MPMLQLQRGVVFLEGASEQAPPGELVSPAQAPPAVPGQVPGPGGQSAGSAAGSGQQKQGQQQKPGQGKQDAAKALGADDPPASADADVTAYRRWLRNGARRGQFECAALAKDGAPPEMAADARVVFKDADAAPKAPAPSPLGLAGTGTRS